MNKEELIRKIKSIINKDGEDFSDGEIIDQIYDVLEKEKSRKL